MLIPLRIKAIGDLLESGDKIADIGADHGLLEIYLADKYEIFHITAIENKKGPFAILKENLEGLEGVKLSLSDGLDEVSDEDTLVLAGMGGINIKNIISRNEAKLKSIKKIVIDAHRDISLARKYIVSLGYEIKSEQIVYEKGKFYVVSKFIKDKLVKYTDDELEFGYKLYNDKLWANFRDYQIEKNNKTIDKIKDNINFQDKVLELTKLNERLLKHGKN